MILTNQKLPPRSFFEQLAKNIGIDHPSEWGRVSVRTVIEKGGKGYISRFGDSLFKALSDTFPGLKMHQLTM